MLLLYVIGEIRPLVCPLFHHLLPHQILPHILRFLKLPKIFRLVLKIVIFLAIKIAFLTTQIVVVLVVLLFISGGGYGDGDLAALCESVEGLTRLGGTVF